MPAYATRTELVTLSVRAEAISSISDADQDTALLSASELADSYLGSRFDLPLTTWGGDLKRIICDIAAYTLLKIRGWSPESGDAEQYRKSYDDAIKWLNGVAKGDITPTLIVDSSGGENDTGNVQDPALVLQPWPGSVSNEQTVWDKESESSVSVIGPPRRRGW